MLVRDAVKKVKEGLALPATIVLTGDEPYMRDMGVQELTRAAGVTEPEMNVAVFEGRPDMQQLREALARFPFLSEKKVVVLRETEILSSAAKTADSQPLEHALIEDHTLFVITAPGKLDRRKSYVKYLMRSALIVECAQLKGEALIKFIESEALRRRLHIGREAARVLAERTQGDMYVLSSELDRYEAVCTGQITRADVERYTPLSDELNMFGIWDLLAGGRYDAAYRDLQRLLQEDATPIGFITFLANTFRQMLVARACRDAGFQERRTVECICAETGAKEWTARRAYERSRQFTAEKLRANVRLLSEIDFGAKQGAYVLETDLYGLLQILFR